jgi:ABC-type glutathione transport system ATPase component
MARDNAEHCILEARDVSRTYRPHKWGGRLKNHVVHALIDVNLAILSGSIIGLVGESGSGKSTLARCITGLERPDSGEIWFEGRELFSVDARELRRCRRKVQLVFQDPATALNPLFTLEEIVTEPLLIAGLPRKQRREQALAVMEQVGLPARWSARRPDELSGGQKQRVAIARALAANPTVLVLDEALSGLDLPIQMQMTGLLLKLHQSLLLTYLFISHDLRLAAYFTDEIVVMQHGRIIEHASTPSLFSNPQHAHTRSLLAAMPKPPAEESQ